MGDSFRFHKFHGPNVVLENQYTEATWRFERSGGILFSKEPLRSRDNIQISCQGSGRVRVGCTKDDPDLYKNKVLESLNDLNDFEMMNEIRFHRRECNVNIFVNEAGDTITSGCGVLKYDKVLHRKQPVWIVIYMMFGDLKISVTKDGRNMTFSDVHGFNVEMNRGKTEATTVLHSPGALCLLDTPLRAGDNIYIRCQPTLDGNYVVSNYHIKLLISDKSPDNLAIDGFRLTDLCFVKPDLTVVETLHKQDCYGDIRISMVDKNTFEYRSANNKVNSQTVYSKVLEGAWVYFELYRVHVKLFPSDLKALSRSHTLLSSRSDTYYQYTHVTFGTRSKTLHNIRPDGTGNRDCVSGEYLATGHRSTSCPENLDHRGLDNVDGLMHSLEDLTTHVKTLYTKVDTLSGMVTGEAADATCASYDQLDARPGAAADSEKDFEELRGSIRRNWRELINCIQTDTMGDLLFQHEVISHVELDKIRKRFKIDGQEANRQILDILLRRGISKTLLNKILEDAGDSHLQRLFFKM